MMLKEKWVLWLKSVTVTIVSILLLMEVVIVCNEAQKIMNEKAVSLCCVNGAMKLDYGNDEKIQLGPSVYDLKEFANSACEIAAVLVPPFNFIVLAEKIVSCF